MAPFRLGRERAFLRAYWFSARQDWGLEKLLLSFLLLSSPAPLFVSSCGSSLARLPGSRLYAHLVWKLLGARTE